MLCALKRIFFRVNLLHTQTCLKPRIFCIQSTKFKITCYLTFNKRAHREIDNECVKQDFSQKSLVFWLLYAGLAATSVLFVKENLKDYIRIKINFQESISDITTSDYPTLTICYEHQYQDMEECLGTLPTGR